MKKNVLIIALAAFLNAIPAAAWKGNITVNTPKTTVVLRADEGGSLRFSYYGEKLTASEVEQLKAYNMDLNQDAYPAFGQTDMMALPAIQVLHADGQ